LPFLSVTLITVIVFIIVCCRGKFGAGSPETNIGIMKIELKMETTAKNLAVYRKKTR